MNPSQRILLLPGFGEDARIFRNIRDALGGYEIFDLTYEAVLDQFSLLNIRMTAFASRMIEHYDIQKEDILIGHSFGGYTAHAIRQQLGCEACLIASFTDPAKVRRRKGVTKWTNVPLILLGSLSSKKARDLMAKVYAERDSLEELLSVMDNFKHFRNMNLAKQDLMMWQKGVDSRLQPSIRIHSAADRIVDPPDEPYLEVPGDHFNLAVYPESVKELIQNWLEKEIKQSLC